MKKYIVSLVLIICFGAASKGQGTNYTVEPTGAYKEINVAADNDLMQELSTAKKLSRQN
jgi:hypothetical protein